MKITKKHKNPHFPHDHNRIRLNGARIGTDADKKSLFVGAHKSNALPNLWKILSSLFGNLMSAVFKIFSSTINLAILIAFASVMPTLWGWYIIPNDLVGSSGEKINVVLRFISSNGVSLEYPAGSGLTSVEYKGVKGGRAPNDSIYVRENLKNVYEFVGESFTIPLERFSQAEPLDMGCMKRLPDARLNRDDLSEGIKGFYLYSVTCDLTYDSVFNKLFSDNKYAKSVSNLAIRGNDIFQNQESAISRIFNVRDAMGRPEDSSSYAGDNSVSGAIWQSTLSQMSTFAPWPLFGWESMFHMATSNKYGHNHYLQGLIAQKHVLHKGDKVFIKHGASQIRFMFLQNNPD